MTATATATTTNADTISALYAAFGRGDLPAILDALSDSVAWEHWPSHTAQRAGLAHLAARTGRDEVAGFFEVLSTWTLNAFEVRDIIGSGRQVVAEVFGDFTLPGGGRFADDELHLWTFDDAGKIIAFRHYLDTAKHIAAAQGVDTTAG